MSAREKADPLCATFTEIIYLSSSLLQKRAFLVAVCYRFMGVDFWLRFGN